MQRVSGSVTRVERKRGPVWYARYRLASGRQGQKALGPAWTGRGRPPAGYFTKRTAEDWLVEFLDEARRDAAAGFVSTGVTFAEAAEEYLRFAEQDRGCKPSTIRGYRSQLNAHLLPAFGTMRIEDITEREIERWRAGITGSRAARPVLSNKTKNHQLVLLHAIFRRAVKVYGLRRNPLVNVDRYRVRASGDIEVFSPEEIWSLVRAASSEMDGVIFLTAAFTGLQAGRAARAALARYRLRGLHDPGPRQLRGRQADDAEVRQGTGRPDGARRRVGPGTDRSARPVHRRGRLRLRR